MKKLSEQSLEMLPLILKGRFTDESINTILIAVNNFDKMKETIIKANDKLAYLYGYNLGKDAVSDVPDMLNDIEQLLESLK